MHSHFLHAPSSLSPSTTLYASPLFFSSLFLSFTLCLFCAGKSGKDCKDSECRYLHPRNVIQKCVLGEACMNFECKRSHPKWRKNPCKFGIKVSEWYHPYLPSLSPLSLLSLCVSLPHAFRDIFPLSLSAQSRIALLPIPPVMVGPGYLRLAHVCMTLIATNKRATYDTPTETGLLRRTMDHWKYVHVCGSVPVHVRVVMLLLLLVLLHNKFS